MLYDWKGKILTQSNVISAQFSTKERTKLKGKERALKLSTVLQTSSLGPKLGCEELSKPYYIEFI